MQMRRPHSKAAATNPTALPWPESKATQTPKPKSARLKGKAAATKANAVAFGGARWHSAMTFFHKNIRLDHHKYAGQHSYFITLCCERRCPVFANSRNAVWLVEKLREESTAFPFAVHAYCVMPDHLHALVTGLEPTSDLLAFVKSLKLSTAREYPSQQRRPPTRRGGRYEGRPQTALWQKKFYDHILRERDNAAGVAAYIWMNPVRKGLCQDPREYPHSGSFILDWRKFVGSVEPWTPDWKSCNSEQ